MVKRLKPVLARHQKIFEATGASSSKNPLLLRNCFNLDVYTQFVKRKREMRNQFKTEYLTRDQEVMGYLSNKMAEGKEISERIQKRLDKIKNEATSQTKRNKLLRLFRDEMKNAAQVDLSFFKAMEIDLD
mmetsp:Transcript_2166/g.3001  ORF Transcript_2166/g.3001 Transcript_2166/m.3001 type:complete len:130 (+) Transcript_2166:284-673(+)